MKTKDDVLTALRAVGLAQRIPDLEPLILSSIRLRSEPVADESGLALGSSKLGGLPDLPATTVWPVWNKVPMSFVAQLNLAQVTPFDVEKSLPSQGILYFFYDAHQQNFGADAVDSGQWRVFYSADIAKLKRTSVPANLPADRLFKACSLTYEVEMTLPLDVSAFGLKWDAPDLKRYSDFMATYPTPADRATAHHRLLGHTDEIQDDMHLQAETEAHKQAQKPPVSASPPLVFAWRLLLQIDTDEHSGMNWANSGMLYYWIEAKALHSQSFDNVWLILQSE